MGLAVAALKDRQRLGGYFCLMQRQYAAEPIIFCHEPIGMVNPQKIVKYFALAGEKTERLAQMYDRYRHLSSWQSRNPDKDRGLFTSRIDKTGSTA